MQNDLDWAKRAKCVSSKIYMASEYFYKFTSLEEILKTKINLIIALLITILAMQEKCKGFLKSQENF